MKPKSSVYIATSLDGFIARKDGSLDWLEQVGSDEDYGYNDFMNTIDVLVMGRNTYQQVLTFGEWPYTGKRVVVLSHTLSNSDIPQYLKGIVDISASAPNELIEELSEAGAKHLYIDGGKTIQSFLNNGLIQELTISRIPVLIGAGIKLFGPLTTDIKLSHIETKTFASGLVQSRYRVEE